MIGLRPLTHVEAALVASLPDSPKGHDMTAPLKPITAQDTLITISAHLWAIQSGKIPDTIDRAHLDTAIEMLADLSRAQMAAVQ